MTLSNALVAARRLEGLARLCQDRLANRDAPGVRTALGQVFDTLDEVEEGLASEFPPRDPGRPT